MLRIFESPRWRRRIVICSCLIAPIVPLVLLGIYFSDPGDPGDANGPLVSGGSSYVQPTPSRFTPAEQRQVHTVLKGFISTAVVRHNVAKAWNLSGPSLKEGVSRKEWNHGDIPVVPYPAANRGLGEWSYVEYSFTDSVGLEVFLFPKPGSGWSAMTADVEVVKGKDNHWRVNYWMPKKFHGPPAVAAGAKAKPKPQRKAAGKRTVTTRSAAPDEAVEPPRASRLWWAVPIGLLGMIVFAPITIAVVFWYRNRRAEREYYRSTGRV